MTYISRGSIVKAYQYKGKDDDFPEWIKEFIQVGRITYNQGKMIVSITDDDFQEVQVNSYIVYLISTKGYGSTYDLLVMDSELFESLYVSIDELQSL